jgi:hypothetical protein
LLINSENEFDDEVKKFLIQDPEIPVTSNNEFESKRLAEMPICELVTEIGRESAHLQKRNILEILAEDTKFMAALEEIHKNFEDGYNKLMTLRKSA